MKKDCGISWFVLAAAFVIQAIVFGVILCVGINVVVQIEQFGSHRVEAALVGSLAYGFQMLTGPLASILYRMFGCRVVIICGAFLAAAGLLLSSVASSVQFLYFSHGLLTGVGLGLVYPSTARILSSYFDKLRYFAQAFVAVGSALGTLLFSAMFLWLINRYDWYELLIINAGLVLQIVILGSLLTDRSHQTVSLNANSNLPEISLPNGSSFIPEGALMSQPNSNHQSSVSPQTSPTVTSHVRLSSVKLYNCSADLFEGESTRFDLLLTMFPPRRRRPKAAWDELVLHGLKAYVEVNEHSARSVVATWPLSLKRLQLSGGLKVIFHSPEGEWEPLSGCFLNALGSLQYLTCLILCSLPSDGNTMTLIETALCNNSTFRELTALKCLVELCIGWSTGDLDYWSEPPHSFPEIMEVCCGLHKLEVLFLHNVYRASKEFFVELVTKHPTLRILVMTGRFVERDDPGEEPIPARRLYPNGFGSAPLPFLRVFLDKLVAETISFEEDSSDALKVYPIIAASLPAFLEKEEIAPIFEGVWIAGQIKEGAKLGAKLCEPLLPIRHAGVE